MDDPEIPERLITANQLVAYNLARFRNAAGLKQEEFGAKMATYAGQPWSKATVSIAERSFDEGARVRQFDAGDLLAFSLILGVPVLGFLLPPAEDGDEVNYLIGGADTAGGITTARLVEVLFSNPTQERNRNVDLYLQLVREALARHLGEDAQKLPAYLARQEAAEALVQIEEHARATAQAAERIRRSMAQAEDGEQS